MPVSAAIVILLTVPLSLIAIRRWLYRGFIWRPDRIRPTIEGNTTGPEDRQYLRLDHAVEPGEDAWMTLKIAIPTVWSVSSVSVESGRVIIRLADGSAYYLGRRNFPRIASATIHGEAQSDSELQALWSRLARARTA